MMPIHLEAPRYNPAGPDGKGWNRLSLGWDPVSSQCALRPYSWAGLWETVNRGGRTARYGSFGYCIGTDRWVPKPGELRAGDCDNCPLYRRHRDEPTALEAFTPTLLVRLKPKDGNLRRQPSNGGLDDEPRIMNRREDGWASYSLAWTWDKLARLRGWKVGRAYRDEHGIGFWLEKENPNTLNGLPDGPPAGPGGAR